MKTIQALTPIVALWLIIFSVQTICCLSFSAFRARRWPQMGPICALAGGYVCLYITTLVPGNPATAGFALFMAAYAGFSAGMRSMATTYKAKPTCPVGDPAVPAPPPAR